MNKNTGEYWDSVLQAQFPLGPLYLSRGWKLNLKTYERQNRQLSRFGNEVMLRELKKLKALHPNGGIIHVFGIGIGRGYQWILEAIRLGFSVRIWDVSRVACDNANRIFKGISGLWYLTQTEIVSGLDSGEINKGEAVAIHASQILEHMDDKLIPLMDHIGEWLCLPRRRFYLFIHRREDNPPDKVRFNSAVPLWDREWQTPLKKKMGIQKKWKDIRRGKQGFFDRVLAARCIYFE